MIRSKKNIFRTIHVLEQNCWNCFRECTNLQLTIIEQNTDKSSECLYRIFSSSHCPSAFQFRTFWNMHISKQNGLLTSIIVKLICWSFSGLTYEFEQFIVSREASSFCVRLSKHRFMNSIESSIDLSGTFLSSMALPITCLRNRTTGKSQNLNEKIGGIFWLIILWLVYGDYYIDSYAES